MAVRGRAGGCVVDAYATHLKATTREARINPVKET